jgi:predicted dehydrogenase
MMNPSIPAIRTTRLAAAAICAGALTAAAEEPSFRLITLDPGHFHAALVQKKMLPGVSPVVHVYAPDGPDLKLHMQRIEGFNSRPDDPTSWDTKIHAGPDFLERMLAEKPGNIVVLAGNNRAKTRYILESVKAGLHVLSDKPMAITPDDFKMLQEAYAIAAEKNLMVNDIMTERHEITTRLQKYFAQQVDFFGTMDPGTPEDPSVTKESVHHFYKIVSGSPLQRPAWFYDVTQQGEGIVDVTTHLVDLVQWGVFPDKVLDLDEASVLSARTWKTTLTPAEFTRSTKVEEIPDYLKPVMNADGKLEIACNGEFVFKLHGVHAKISVIWDYEAPAGAGDTHYSLMRGTKASAIIRQGAGQGYKPVLYLEPRAGVDAASLDEPLRKAVDQAAAMWPGITVTRTDAGWMVNIPASYHLGHEAHFSKVAEDFLGYVKSGRMPEWEVPNTLAKYRTIMDAWRMSR